MTLLFAARPRTRSTWPDRRFGSEAPIARRGTTSRLQRLGVNVKQTSLARADGRVDEEVAHPHPSQTRMCRFPASGSSWERLTRGGADTTIRDLPAKNDA